MDFPFHDDFFLFSFFFFSLFSLCRGRTKYVLDYTKSISKFSGDTREAPGTRRRRRRGGVGQVVRTAGAKLVIRYYHSNITYLPLPTAAFYKHANHDAQLEYWVVLVGYLKATC